MLAKLRLLNAAPEGVKVLVSRDATSDSCSGYLLQSQGTLPNSKPHQKHQTPL